MEKLGQSQEVVKLCTAYDHGREPNGSRPLQEGRGPFYSQPYRSGPDRRRVTEDKAQKLVRDNVTEPSTSPWATPVVLAPETDGMILFCAYCRKLYAVTKKVSHPIPRLEDYIDSLGLAEWFTT